MIDTAYLFHLIGHYELNADQLCVTVRPHR